MGNKDSEAIQDEINKFLKKLEKPPGGKKGQKSTTAAKKELPKGKKGQAPVPISSVEVAPVLKPAPTKFDDFVALVKKTNFTTEQIKGFTPVDKGDEDYGKVFPLEEFSKMVVPDKYMPPEIKEYAMDVGLVAYALLKPEWSEKIGCVSKVEGVQTVPLKSFSIYLDEQWGHTISKSLAKEMEKASEIVGGGEPITTILPTDEIVTAFVQSLPDKEYYQVLEKVLKKFPLLHDGDALTMLIEKAMTEKAAAEGKPLPSIADIPYEQFEPIKECLILKAKGKAPLSLTYVANHFKVQYDSHLEHLWAAIQQVMLEHTPTDAETMMDKVGYAALIGKWAETELKKMQGEGESLKMDKAGGGKYLPYLTKLGEMAGLLAETGDFEIPDEDVVLVKEGDKYIAMTPEDTLKYLVQKYGVPPPGVLDEIFKSAALKMPIPLNAIGGSSQIVNLKLSMDETTSEVIKHIFKLMNELMSFSLKKNSENLQGLDEKLNNLEGNVISSFKLISDMIAEVNKEGSAEQIQEVNQKLEELKNYVNAKFSVLNMNLGKLSKQVKQKK